MNLSLNFRRCMVVVCLMAAVPIRYAFGWGKAGHKIVNRVAIEMLPAAVPAFLRNPQAIEEVEYLGPEPDRWRSSAEPELSVAQSPDHFIDLELADLAAPNGLPARRYQFLADVNQAQEKYPRMAEKLTPQRVGLLPWQVDEEFERLTQDMREYRWRLAVHKPVDGAELAILYDAGLLGHYVADGSQPLHTTVNYDGWVESENPKHFTREHGIHSEFETQFVEASIRAPQVRALVPSTPHLLDSPFQDIVEYLRASHAQVGEVYRLQKHGAFDAGTAEARSFTAERLAAGAAMLRDMIVTAWVQSAQSSDWKRR